MGYRSDWVNLISATCNFIQHAITAREIAIVYSQGIFSRNDIGNLQFFSQIRYSVAGSLV